MDKRLFLAINLPKDLKQRLFEWQQIYQSDRRWRRFKIKWTPVDNLHITVAFLGNIAEADIDSLKNKLSLNLNNFPPVQLSFDKLSLAPPRGQPRMIWAYFIADNKFIDLVDAVWRAAEEFVNLEMRRDIKSVYPHITLARFKQPVDRGRTQSLGSFNYIFKAEEVVLMESKLTRQRPFYYNLASFKLTG